MKPVLSLTQQICFVSDRKQILSTQLTTLCKSVVCDHTHATPEKVIHSYVKTQGLFCVLLNIIIILVNIILLCKIKPFTVLSTARKAELFGYCIEIIQAHFLIKT